MNSIISDVRFGDIQLTTGVRLHYAEAGSAGKEAILFLHGYSDSCHSFSKLLPSFPSSLRAYAPDQRGHGNSERPACCYSMADFANDAVAFLDAVGVRRATVVGHSMGSVIAQKMAIEHADRVERLVLAGSTTTMVNELVLGLQEQVRMLTDPVPTKFISEFQSGTVYREIAAPFMATAIAESGKLPARVWREVMAGMLAADTGDKLHNIQCPTLILWGDRDMIFGREEQEKLRAAIPDATLRVYADTGHALHWEQPERFVEDLRQFIQSTQALTATKSSPLPRTSSADLARR